MQKDDIITNSWSSFFLKAIGGAFMIGIAWARLEYKIDEFSGQLLKKIDEHIISDGYDKQILNSRVDELTIRINDLKLQLANYKEFVKPEEVKPKNYR